MSGAPDRDARLRACAAEGWVASKAEWVAAGRFLQQLLDEVGVGAWVQLVEDCGMSHARARVLLSDFREEADFASLAQRFYRGSTT